MVGPAQQDQVVQIGGAAIQPVDQMVGLAPGKGALAAREDTAAVAYGQGGALGGGDDPGGAAEVQGLGRGPTQDRGQPPGRGPQPFGQTALAPGIKVAVVTAGVVLSLMATEFLVAEGKADPARPLVRSQQPGTSGHGSAPRGGFCPGATRT